MLFPVSILNASREYHICKETNWSVVKIDNAVKVDLKRVYSSIENDPYACVIKTRHKYYVGLKTVGNVPRKITRYVYFL